MHFDCFIAVVAICFTKETMCVIRDTVNDIFV